MRSLAIVLLVGCASSSPPPSRPAPAPPPAPGDLGHRLPAHASPQTLPSMAFTDRQTGWCAPPPAPLNRPIAHTFEVSPDRTSVRELGPESRGPEGTPWPRGGHGNGYYTWLNPTIDRGKLRMSTSPTSCRDTSSGCRRGYWEQPARVILSESVPAGSCIRYAFGTSGSSPSIIVVGFDHEWRVFSRKPDDNQPVRGPTVQVPTMSPIGVVDDVTFLQEPTGQLWIVRDGKPAPSLVPGALLGGQATRVAGSMHGFVRVFTDTALYLLDDRTFAVQLEIRGDVWDASTLDHSQHHLVLAIEHGANARVILRELDARGREVYGLVVHQGRAIAARMATADGKLYIQITN